MANELENSTKLGEARDTFIQGAGNVSSALLGMVNRVGGQIYALLFLNDDPLSLDEIAEQLHISKSNISINIRLLEDMVLVKKVWVKGSRKDYYRAQRTYPKKVIINFLEKIQRTFQDANLTIEKTRSQIVEASNCSKEGEKEKAAFMLDKVELIGSFYKATDQFFEAFFSGEPINVDLLRYAILNPEDISKSKKK